MWVKTERRVKKAASLVIAKEQAFEWGLGKGNRNMPEKS